MRLVVVHWLAAALIGAGAALVAVSTLGWRSAPPALLGPAILVAVVLAVLVAAVPLRPVATIAAIFSATYAASTCILIVLEPSFLLIAAAVSFGAAAGLTMIAATGRLEGRA